MNIAADICGLHVDILLPVFGLRGRVVSVWMDGGGYGRGADDQTACEPRSRLPGNDNMMVSIILMWVRMLLLWNSRLLWLH